MTGACDTDVTFLKKGQKIKFLVNALNPLVLRRAYQSFLPIKAVKLADIKQLLNYVHLPEHATFYSLLKADIDVVENEPEDEFE